jgi:2,4-dienoyl-CoA reductase-like NADH-dependent reductase (Old Yellow Enzyme family)
MLERVPNGRGLTLHTTSEFLVAEGEKFRGWVESGSIQNVWDQRHSDWKNIFGSMELQGKLIGIELWHAGEFEQQEAALSKHCEERIQKMETCAREPTLDDDPGEPPWA